MHYSQISVHSLWHVYIRIDYQFSKTKIPNLVSHYSSFLIIVNVGFQFLQRRYLALLVQWNQKCDVKDWRRQNRKRNVKYLGVFRIIKQNSAKLKHILLSIFLYIDLNTWGGCQPVWNDQAEAARQTGGIHLVFRFSWRQRDVKMGHDAWKGGVNCIQGVILVLKLLNTPWFKKVASNWKPGVVSSWILGYLNANVGVILEGKLNTVSVAMIFAKWHYVKKSVVNSFGWKF